MRAKIAAQLAATCKFEGEKTELV